MHCIPEFLGSCVAQTTTWNCYVLKMSTLAHLRTSTPKEIFPFLSVAFKFGFAACFQKLPQNSNCL